MTSTETLDRAQPVERAHPTVGEEIANAITHGLGAVASLVALVILAIAASSKGSIALLAFCTFGASMFALYLASTLYHALPPSKAKNVFRILDHSAIYVLIAGTYTPFTLGVLKGVWGWSLFALEWGLAAAGIALKSVHGIRWPRLSMAVYIMMGWLVIVAAWPLITRVPATGLILMLVGGLLYTGGAAFFGLKRIRFTHMIWHFFVMGGSVCMFFAVLHYAMPA